MQKNEIDESEIKNNVDFEIKNDNEDHIETDFENFMKENLELRIKIKKLER